MSTWATLTEVLNITHKDDLVQDDVDVAEEVIVLHTERTPDDSLRTRDLYWLKRAVAWQAAWQVNQPGYAERSTAKEISQDGTKIVYAHAGDPSNPALFMLAPLAQRALKNCSWMKSRSDRWRPARPPQDTAANFVWPERVWPTDYTSNDDHPWVAM